MTRHLLVIGAQRCGTTYLHSLLDAHPDLTMARPTRPEPKVFLSAELTARGLGWYRSTYFSHATEEALLGEKSTSYIEHPLAATRAASVLGRAEIVVLLRDPVARAVSNWQFSTTNRLEDRPLERALADNLDGARDWDPAATSVSPYAYLERGCYADYLEPWLMAFPGRLHLYFLEDLVTADSVLAQIYNDLGVDPDFRPNHLGEPVNRSLQRAPELKPALAAQLRDFFADSDARLSALIQRNVPWNDEPLNSAERGWRRSASSVSGA